MTNINSLSPWLLLIEFLVFNTNLVFLVSLYKIDFEGLEKFQQKSKLPLQWKLNSQHQRSRDYKLDAYSTLPPRHVLNRRSLNSTLFHTPIHILTELFHSLAREMGNIFE